MYTMIARFLSVCGLFALVLSSGGPWVQPGSLWCHGRSECSPQPQEIGPFG
jgi:hypothetical protein